MALNKGWPFKMFASLTKCFARYQICVDIIVYFFYEPSLEGEHISLPHWQLRASTYLLPSQNFPLQVERVLNYLRQ